MTTNQVYSINDFQGKRDSSLLDGNWNAACYCSCTLHVGEGFHLFKFQRAASVFEDPLTTGDINRAGTRYDSLLKVNITSSFTDSKQFISAVSRECIRENFFSF